MLFAPILLVLAGLIASCAGDLGAPTGTSSGTGPESSRSPTPDTDSSADPGGSRTPVPPSLPPDPGYSSRLGRYADFVLSGGLVPYGSPEHIQYLADCIRSAGFQVEVDQGGLLAEPGPEQEQNYREASNACEQAAIESGLVGPLEPPDEDELAAWYEAYLLTYECMLAAGYATTAPPSEDAYIESDGRIWHPFETLSGGMISVVEDTCPQDLVVLFEMLAAGTEP